MEKLIKESGSKTIRINLMGNEWYKETFYYKFIYIYDGVRFLIGSFDAGVVERMVEESTELYASKLADKKGTDQMRVDKLISIFKERLQRSGTSLTNVISKTRVLTYKELELWKVNQVLPINLG